MRYATIKQYLGQRRVLQKCADALKVKHGNAVGFKRTSGIYGDFAGPVDQDDLQRERESAFPGSAWGLLRSGA